LIGVVGGGLSIFREVRDLFFRRPNVETVVGSPLVIRYAPVDQELTFIASFVIENSGSKAETIQEMQGWLKADAAELMRFGSTDIKCTSTGISLAVPFVVGADLPSRVECSSGMKASNNSHPVQERDVTVCVCDSLSADGASGAARAHAGGLELSSRSPRAARRV
jgi:hypothetical protein